MDADDGALWAADDRRRRFSSLDERRLPVQSGKFATERVGKRCRESPGDVATTAGGDEVDVLGKAPVGDGDGPGPFPPMKTTSSVASALMAARRCEIRWSRRTWDSSTPKVRATSWSSSGSSTSGPVGGEGVVECAAR